MHSLNILCMPFLFLGTTKCTMNQSPVCSVFYVKQFARHPTAGISLNLRLVEVHRAWPP